MRLRELLFEVRKNPEKNPKVSINDAIIDRLHVTTGMKGGTRNLFVSFTMIDKLGIYPQSKYDTPLGIYTYPAEYVYQKIGREKRMANLPFVGHAPYASIFNAKGNIIDLPNMAPDEAVGYYRKIGEYLTKTIRGEWKDTMDKLEYYINTAETNALFPNKVGGRFWYVTYKVASLISKHNGTRMPVAWNKLFREIGIDGAVDHTGIGIIHTNEPTQGVFFSTAAVENVQRVYNKYSPESIEKGKKIERDLATAKSLKGMELVHYLIDHPDLLTLLPKIPDNIKMAVVKSTPALIAKFNKPSNDVIYAAITSHYAFDIIMFIFKNSEFSLVAEQIQRSPELIKKIAEHTSKILKYIDSFYITPEIELAGIKTAIEDGYTGELLHKYTPHKENIPYILSHVRFGDIPEEYVHQVPAEAGLKLVLSRDDYADYGHNDAIFFLVKNYAKFTPEALNDRMIELIPDNIKDLKNVTREQVIRAFANMSVGGLLSKDSISYALSSPYHSEIVNTIKERYPNPSSRLLSIIDSYEGING